MYDRQKEDEAILYLAQQLEPAYPQKVMDVLYRAEKLHLSKYGRTITGCRWVAYQAGPRPRRFRGTRLLPESGGKYELHECDEAETTFPYRQLHVVRPLREPDRMHFSKSDEECLDEAIRLNREQGEMGAFKAARDFVWHEATHFLRSDYPGDHASMPLLGIALCLPNAVEVIQCLYVTGQLKLLD